MRFITYEGPHGPRVAGVLAGSPRRMVDLNAADPSLPTSLKELLTLGASGLARAEAAIASGAAIDGSLHKLLAPIPDPQKIICVGLNYADHAKETGKEPPSEPILFSKLATAVAADGQPIELPPVSQQVDYEAELVVVIGHAGKNIARKDAWRHIAGYTCGNDVSARDWQLKKPGGQWLLGKSFDTFAPFGPELVTADEVGDPGELHIELRLNGQVMQSSTTAQLIFPVDALVAYVSQVCTLSVGDVIFTGTPPGVGAARKPPVFLRPGDVVEVEIERIGVLRNPMVSVPPRAPLGATCL